LNNLFIDGELSGHSVTLVLGFSWRMSPGLPGVVGKQLDETGTEKLLFKKAADKLAASHHHSRHPAI
jgi:hypothetical protein